MPGMAGVPNNEHLGFGIVGHTNGGFFECSPLSFNGVAKKIAVNRFCLVDDVERAIDIAKDFSRPESRVEPAWALPCRGSEAAVQSTLTITKQRIAGIDGCPAGWIAAIAAVDDFANVQIRVFARFTDIIESGPFVCIAVDMPIGLPERAGPGGRGAERAVRPFLGARRSSVFSVPARRAVYAVDYETACKEALEHSDPPRRISKQSFAIFPKIREIDGLLRDNPYLANIVHEVHPELAFWRMNGDKPLETPKKMNGKPYSVGLDERRKLLVSAGISEAVVSAKRPRGAAIDDMLDALAGLVIAKRLVDGIARPFPDPPMHDGYGLPIAIWA